jgi:hypothetical protein
VRCTSVGLSYQACYERKPAVAGSGEELPRSMVDGDETLMRHWLANAGLLSLRQFGRKILIPLDFLSRPDCKAWEEGP